MSSYRIISLSSFSTLLCKIHFRSENSLIVSFWGGLIWIYSFLPKFFLAILSTFESFSVANFSCFQISKKFFTKTKQNKTNKQIKNMISKGEGRRRTLVWINCGLNWIPFVFFVGNGKLFPRSSKHVACRKTGAWIILTHLVLFYVLNKVVKLYCLNMLLSLY